MKKLTNHTIGPRGVNLKDGTTRWIDPGQTVEIEAGDIVGEVPDLGKPGDAPAADGGEIETLTAQLAAVTKERDDLKAQVAKFDPDGDGKAGGSKPAAQK